MKAIPLFTLCWRLTKLLFVLLVFGTQLYTQTGVAAVPGVGPSSDPHSLSGIWTWGEQGSPPLGSPPLPPNADASSEAMVAAPPFGGYNHVSIAPIIKPEYQSRFKSGEYAPQQGSLRNTDTSMLCIPDGYFGTGGGYPTAIVQTATQVTLINEENHRFRRIYLDGRSHPGDFRDSYAGHSIGHWEGDTLVVETVGLRERDGDIHPPGFHIIEHFQKRENGKALRYSVMFHSDAYEKPGINEWTYYLRPDLHILESVCEEFSDNFDEDYYQ